MFICLPLVILFSIFPLTDTDIWWHLACAREWVTTWTPVRAPIVNVHEYFQLVVGFVYSLGGAPLLVAFKAVLWGVVFVLFLCPAKRFRLKFPIVLVILFLFRYHFEIRPVLFSLLFLGFYWNIFPRFFLLRHCEHRRGDAIHKLVVAIVLLAIQWVWCKCQGLYILGPIFATLVLCASLLESKKQGGLCAKTIAPQVVFVLLLWLMPFLHREGLALFLYPFGLLDRLLGLTPSAAVFASQIAENRSPITLLMAGENVLESLLMVVLCAVGIVVGIRGLVLKNCHPERNAVRHVVEGSKYQWLLITALLALIAERNFVLFLPVLFHNYQTLITNQFRIPNSEFRIISLVFRLSSLVCIAFLLGLWVRSLFAYDKSMVAYQRVPVQAAAWMAKYPHSGRLFNDDRAGGYLALMNPADSIYIDGRFILKTADFFERYLNYAENPALFMHDADSLGVDRALFPLQYYARWDNLMLALDKASRWRLVYRDEYFAVFDKK